MTTRLKPLKEKDTRKRPKVAVRDRQHHTRIAGHVEEAFLTDASPFISSGRGLKGAKAKGKAYEKKALGYLEGYLGEFLLPSPWIAYRERGSHGSRLCQPDGLFVDLERGTIRIFEIKLKHTADSWWQLHKLYTPVVSVLFGPEWMVECVEVVKYFDPHVEYPGRFSFISTPVHTFNTPTAVHIFSP